MCLLGACADKRPAPNVLLVTVDTLRQDGLGAAMPAMEKLGSAGVVFSEGRAPASWTLPSLASLMTGVYPSTHGCKDMRSALDDSYSTLAERLGAAGYATGAVASHVFLKPDYGLAQGFDDYNTDLVKSLMKSHEAISSPGVTERAFEFMDERIAAEDGAPFLLWAHYFDPHDVYREHKGFSKRYGKATEEQRYRGEVGYTDRWIGKLLEGLEARGLAENTVVVLVADHGEEFGEHGGLRHGHTLYDELLRVPFVIRAPGVVAPATLQTPANSVDLLPTILELCDVALGPGAIAGISLVPAMKGDPAAIVAPRPLLHEVRLRKGRMADAVVFNGWKLIRHRDGKRQGQVELYDLDKDPGEQNDLSAGEVEHVGELTVLLDRMLENAVAAASFYGESGGVDLDASEVQRLGDLGYADGPEESR